MQLTGNTILITGGSAGIGLAFAEKFLELGNEVIVTGRNADKLAAAAAANPGLHTMVCDAADPDAISGLAERLASEFPKLNVLMNNAGIFQYQNLLAGTDDLSSYTREVDVNVAGPIRTTAALIGQIRENAGVIINVSSGLAFVPLQCSPIYCATKAALHSYTLSLRQQLADTAIEVIELMPPAVKTELTAELPQDGEFKMLTTDELVHDTIRALQAGKQEIRPGQANQLHWMSRIAPGFINGQLAKGSKDLIPTA